MGLDWPKPNCVEEKGGQLIGVSSCLVKGVWFVYLFDLERGLDLRYVVLDILLQGGNVNGLADLSSHCCCFTA